MTVAANCNAREGIPKFVLGSRNMCGNKSKKEINVGKM
jgi:hypothetical protein